ncbi:hypothetical protein AAFC00_004616 [Neodothiora populina]|uniref:Wings apart-like protein C-terminal domain-containing protein n=1 Tax=Neodothiora populina TaxID=2781224 RepID=A0ABR3P3Z5_9PEZI
MDRKRKRSSTGHEVEWTAARCHRLLRPIASRVAPLQKLAYITDSHRPEKTRNPKDVGRPSAVRQTGLSEDPAWLRRADEQTKLKSYKSKDRTTRKNGRPTASEAEQPPQVTLVSLPTPFKTRALRRNTSGKTPVKKHDGDLSATPCMKLDVQLRKRSRRDPFAHAPVAMQSAELHDRQAFEKVFELHQGVTDGFSLLLQRTEPRATQKDTSTQDRRGARSLFSTCLKRIPDYIQAEEGWRNSVDPDDETDVSAEVYEELEELGSSGHGWSPLREVVRAHGVKLIKDLIESKLVSVKTRAELANMPLQHGSMHDAEMLALTFAQSLPSRRPLNTSSLLLDGCLSNMSHLVIFERSSSVRLRILHKLFSNKNLPVSWAGTKDMPLILSQAVRLLSSSSQSDALNVMQFLGGLFGQIFDMDQTSMRKSIDNEMSQIEDDALMITSSMSPSLTKSVSRTMDSLLMILTAMAIIPDRQDDCCNDSPADASWHASMLIHSLSMTVLMRPAAKGNLGQRHGHKMPSSQYTMFKVLTAMLIVLIKHTHAGCTISGVEIDELVSAMCGISSSDRTAMEEAACFISDLAFCCGQSLQFDAQDILEDLVQTLMTTSTALSVEWKMFFQQIALETALTFAKVTRTRKSKDFVQLVEQSVLREGSMPVKLQPAQYGRAQDVKPRNNFRWEEGLCEWIAATPFTSRKAQSRITHFNTQSSPLSKVPANQDDEAALPTALLSTEGYNDDLHDSGYLTLHETPKGPGSSASSSILSSSPDVLADDLEGNFFPEFGGRLAPLAIRGQSTSPSTVTTALPSKPPPLFATSSRCAVQSQNNTTNKSRSVCLESPAPTSPSNVHIATAKDAAADAAHSTHKENLQRDSKSRSISSGDDAPRNVYPKETVKTASAATGHRTSKATSEQRRPAMSRPQATTPTRYSSVNKKRANTSSDSELDFDELAMSVVKAKPKHSSLPCTTNNPTVAKPKSRTKDVRVAKTKPSRVVASEDSDDELGA